MKITINLATRPFADLGPMIKRLRIAMAVFAVVSIGLGIGLHLLHNKAEAARARNHSLDGQIAAINHERQTYVAMMGQPNNAQVLQQANNLNHLFDQKAFSWTLAMEDLETVLPGGVQVTTLEPIREDKTSRITLRLRVDGPRDKNLDLVHNLEYSKHFLRPTIVNESTESNAAPGQALEPVSASNKVDFDLLTEYNPAALRDAPTTEEKAEKPAKAAVSPTPALHKTGTPATGPGLRKPPYTGVSQPPSGLLSPAEQRRAGIMHRYPATPPTQPAPTTQTQPARKPRPGGPQ